jgi:hypothetical protein
VYLALHVVSDSRHWESLIENNLDRCNKYIYIRILFICCKARDKDKDVLFSEVLIDLLDAMSAI